MKANEARKLVKDTAPARHIKAEQKAAARAVEYAKTIEDENNRIAVTVGKIMPQLYGCIKSEAIMGGSNIKFHRWGNEQYSSMAGVCFGNDINDRVVTAVLNSLTVDGYQAFDRHEIHSWEDSGHDEHYLLVSWK